MILLIGNFLSIIPWGAIFGNMGVCIQLIGLMIVFLCAIWFK